jgi:hypothetical protein
MLHSANDQPGVLNDADASMLPRNAFAAMVQRKLTRSDAIPPASRALVDPITKWLVMMGMTYGVQNADVRFHVPLSWLFFHS